MSHFSINKVYVFGPIKILGLLKKNRNKKDTFNRIEGIKNVE